LSFQFGSDSPDRGRRAPLEAYGTGQGPATDTTTPPASLAASATRRAQGTGGGLDLRL
jgi:hypothetical protein